MDSSMVLDQAEGNGWAIYNADSCALLGSDNIPAERVGLSVFSPPFLDLFTYSDSLNDMGNVSSDRVFFDHYAYLARALYRLTMPGRIVAMHCWDQPTLKSRHGYVGLLDFPGMLIRAMQEAGFIFHSRTTIWKDPVVAMQRSHALGLLHKQVKIDSSHSRCTIADYLIAMRKPGINPRPIVHTDDALALTDDSGKPLTWQRYAQCVWAMPGSADEMPMPHPVWATAKTVGGDGMVDYEDPNARNPDKRGVDQGDTLQAASVRQDKDEKHMCPLQLEVIRRAVKLWSLPGDVVLTPFAGIGSELYVAVQMDRLGLGVELKPEYYAQAVANVRSIERGAKGTQPSLFALDDLYPDGADIVKPKRGKRR